MKNLFIALFLSVGLMTGTAQAVPIEFSEVGSIDDLIGGFDGIGNSEAEESAFLEEYLDDNGFDTTLFEYDKIDLGGATTYVEVINGPLGTNLLAIDFEAFGTIADPTVFLVKFGNAEFEHYLYENLDSLRYGVIDLNEITADSGTITITSVSHTGTGSVPTTPTTPVPEPASFSLMLLGLASTGLVARRKQ